MLASRFKAAPFIMIYLLLGLSAEVWCAPTACLGKKDVKRVQKATDPAKRMLIYVDVARKSATTLAACLSPWAELSVGRREKATVPIWVPTRCDAVQNMIADVGCTEQPIQEELPAWRQVRTTSDIALIKARWELEIAESELGYAEVDAQRPKLHLRAMVANQIKSRR